MLTAVDFGIVLAVLDTGTGQVRALRGADRQAWLANPAGPVRAATPPPPSTGTVDVPVRLADPHAAPRIPAAQRILATAALTIAARATGGGFGGQLRIVVATHRNARREATLHELNRAATAVRAAAATLPFRVSALDEAVGTLALLGFRRTTARFRFGVTLDPLDTHAWLELSTGRSVDRALVERFTAFPSRSRPATRTGRCSAA